MAIKIVILMLEAGAGHKIPALAVAKAIERQYPNQYEIEVLDAMKHCGALKDDARLKGSWDKALAHPFLTSVAYGLMQLGYFAAPRVSSWVFSEFWNRLDEWLIDKKPDLVFATHPTCTSAAVDARRRHNLLFPIVSLVTDPFCAHALWAERHADAIIIGSDKGERDLRSKGVPGNRILRLPFPIHTKYFRPPDTTRDEIQRRYGIDPVRLTILANDGGQGIGKALPFALKLYRDSVPVNILGVCAKNHFMHEEMEAFKIHTRSSTNLIPLGFVSNMEELLAVTDIVIGKAGVSTTFETLLTGTPMCFTSYAAKHEKSIVDWSVSNRIGFYVPRYRQLRRLVEEFRSGARLEETRALIRNFDLNAEMEKADERIAGFLVNCLENGPISALNTSARPLAIARNRY